MAGRDNDFVPVLYETVFESAVDTVVQRWQPVVGVVDRIKAQYGKLLASEGMDQPATPGFQENEPWKMLADSWLRRKKASIANPRFYFGLSESEGEQPLKEAVAGMKTKDLFGKTTFNAYLVSRTDIKRWDGFMRRGKKIRVVYRDPKGMFREAWRYQPDTKVSITINPFPELRTSWSADNRNTGSDILKELPLAVDQKKKLEYNMNSRPLLSAFTRWFVDKRINRAIQEWKRSI